MKDHPEAAKAVLPLLFPNTTINELDQAIYLDKMFEKRNSPFLASIFAGLDKMIGRVRVLQAAQTADPRFMHPSGQLLSRRA